MIRTMWRRRIVPVAVLAMASISATSVSQQTPASASVATVTFTQDFPQYNPAHYSITVNADGHARYECKGKMVADSEDEAYRSEFDVSAAGRDKIFDWTKRAQYFTGKIDSGNRKVAFTGSKVLSYQDRQRSNRAQYNYSSLAAVQELTAFFQNMGNTLEFGRRLVYFHRYQKLALDDELKRMEEQARSNELSEIQSIAPVLREIFEDSAVINGVRARAKELMQMGSGAGGGH